MDTKFAAVLFKEKNEYSEVPSNWLMDVGSDGQGSCNWPPPLIKNVNFFIKNRCPPEDDWPTYKVEIVRYCDTLEKARKAALDSDYTTSEEIVQGRGHRKKVSKLLSDSDNTSDGDEIVKNGKKVPPAPKLPEMLKTASVNVNKTNIAYNESEYSESEHSEKSNEKLIEISPDDDIPRRLHSLEEKLNVALNLLGKLVVGVKGIQQNLSLQTDVEKNLINENLQIIKNSLPLETKEAVEEFENMLSKHKYHEEFAVMIQQIGGSSGKDFTERSFVKIFSPLFAKDNTWDGKVTKYAVKELTLISIIQEIILKKFPYWSSAEFEKVASNWLRLGNQRAGQQPAQKIKKDTTTNNKAISKQ